MSDIQSLLPTILHHDTIAKLEYDKLLIGDRRVYPFEKKYFVANNVFEAASAIKNMVTQGGGPLEVALLSLIMIARQNGKDEKAFREGVKALSLARPTNTTMARELNNLLSDILKAFDDDDFIFKVVKIVNCKLSYYDYLYDKMSDYGKTLIDNNDGILTTCFPEHSFFLSIYKAREEGKSFCVYAPETRPYLQGARLTAASLAEMGFEHYLITDNMVGTFMGLGKINKYMTAVDLALKDYTVVNKIGTLQNAICANYYNIPYYPFSISFDETKDNIRDVEIEYRDSKEVKLFKGVKTTSDEVRAIYPCFDIIPSKLVTGIVTPDGVRRWMQLY